MPRRQSSSVPAHRAKDALVDQTDRLQTLSEISRAVTATLDLRTLYDTIYEQIGRVMDTTQFFIALYRSGRGTVDIPYHREGGKLYLDQVISYARSVTTLVMERGTPLLFHTQADYQRYAAENGLPEITLGDQESEAMIFVPLNTGRRTIGALSVQSGGQNVYSQSDVQTLLVIASQAAVAIENARLFTDQQNRVFELQAIQSLVQKLAPLHDIPSIAHVIDDELKHLIDYHACRVFSLDPGERRLTPISTSDTPFNLDIGEGFAGWVALHGESVIIPNTLLDPRVKHLSGTPVREESMMGAPLIYEGRVRGVITLSRLGSDQFDENSLRLLEIVAAQTAIVFDRARLYSELRTEAVTDPLTKLPNRRYMLDRFKEERSRALRNGHPLTALMVDIDKFKRVNDRFGHDAGDVVLQELAAMIRSVVRAEDIVARWGGEEFCVLLPQITIEGAEQAAERLRVTIERRRLPKAAGVRHISASIGLARLDTQDEDIEVFTRSDRAMYEAKYKGGNRVCVSEGEEYRLADVEGSAVRRRKSRVDTPAEPVNSPTRRLLDSLWLVAVELDLQGRARYVNPYFLDMTEYGRDEVLGRHWFSTFLPAEDQHASTQAINQLLRYNFHPHFESAIVTKSGETRTISWNNVLQHDDEGAVIGTLSIGEDVTERRQMERALQEASSFNDEVISNLQQGVIVFDRDLRYVVWNAYMERISGMPAEKVLGRSGLDLFPHLRETGVDQLLQRALNGETVRTHDNPYYVPATGKVGWSSATYSPHRDANGEVVGVVAVVSDITERKRAEEAIRESEARYRSLVETSPDAITTTDLQGVVTMANRRTAEIHGYDCPDEMIGMNAFDLIAPEDRERAAEGLNQVLEKDSVTGLEYTLLTRDGSTFPAELNVSLIRDEAGRPRAFIGVVRDISERRRVQAELEHQGLHDTLTYLPNRTLLRDRLQQAILAAHRTSGTLALLLMDLDRFKEVNDTFGHHYGDLLLQQVGLRLAGVLRESDTVARLGGDEFAVLLLATDAAGATTAARKVIATLEEPFILGDQTVGTDASIGIALYPGHGDDANTLLRSADVAMYVAKRNGSGYAVYTSEHDPYRPDTLALVTELRQAIERGELLLHYQPKVNMRTRCADYVEALVRWQHPTRGFIPPDQFIPLAERTGLIKQLTLWVLSEALRQCRSWQSAGLGIRVAVNLSTYNLQDPHLVETVDGLLRACDVPPRLLEVEITETAVMADPDRALDALTRLHDMGVRISIDDFGTGYSSLAYLKRLPVDEIKIDRSFVMDMATNENDFRIVRGTISLGRDLDLQTVAEGVEDRETWDMLAAMGCDLAQGYYLSRPVPSEELATWMDETKPGLAS